MSGAKEKEKKGKVGGGKERVVLLPKQSESLLEQWRVASLSARKEIEAQDFLSRLEKGRRIRVVNREVAERADLEIILNKPMVISGTLEILARSGEKVATVLVWHNGYGRRVSVMDLPREVFVRRER